MRKFKLDKNTSIRISSLAMAGMLFVTAIGFTGCSKKDDTTTSITIVQTKQDEINKEIKSLFPILSQDIIDNTSLIIMLDEIAKKDENGKINSKEISKFKSKIDSDNMMNDFNSFIDVLEYTMLNNKEIVVVSDIVLEKDKDILSKIEKITSSIIKGENKESNIKLINTLFVEEDKITYDGLTFEVRDLSYSARAIAGAYARTSLNFSKEILTEEEINKLDCRTNDQNNKAYIKTTLEILSNNIEEKSETNINKLFKEEYSEFKTNHNNKIKLNDDKINLLVNYMNLEYLASDKVSNKDKNNTLGEYTEQKISDTLTTIDCITEYNANNKNNIILLSENLVDKYKATETGKIDSIFLDYIQFNSIMFLNSTTTTSTKEEIFANPYFRNIYDYFRKASITHQYPDGTKVVINYQNISDGVKLIANEIVCYTLNKRPIAKEFEGYEALINSNLAESIQYVQNTITGECEKVDEFVKIK